MNPFSIDSALGQAEGSSDGDSGPTAEQMAAWEEQAKEYADKGKYEQAIAIYNSILSQYPGTDAAQQSWTQTAQLYIRAGNSAAAESAIQVLQTEFGQHSETAKSLCLIGKTYYQNGMAPNANALHQYNVDNFPDSKYAMWSQVEIVSFHLDNKDFAHAGSATETMLSSFSGQEALPLGIYLLAGRFQKAGDEAKALELHRYNVDHFPDSQRAVLSQVDIICSHLNNRDFSNAELAKETLYSRFAGHEALPEGIYTLANHYFRQMGDQATGLELHRYNVDHFADSQFAMMSQGIITKDYLTKGDFDNAELAMETLLSRFAGQETLPKEVYKIAKYYYAQKDRQDKAIELYQYMAATWPEDDYALLSLKEEAISRIKRHQEVAAQEVIDILLTNFAEHKKLAQALNGIANAYHQVQDDEKALEYYQYVIEHWPGTGHALSSLGSLVKMLMYQGKVLEAETYLHELWTAYDAEPGLANTLLGISPWLRYYEEYDLAILVNMYILNALSPSANEKIRAEIELAKTEESLGLAGYVLETIRYLIEEYAGNPHLPRLIFIAGEEYYEKGFGCENEGDREKAHDNFFHAIKIWDVVIHDLPEDAHYTPIAYYFSAVCFSRLKDYQSTIAYYQKVVHSWTNHDKVPRARYRIKRYRGILARQK